MGSRGSKVHHHPLPSSRRSTQSDSGTVPRIVLLGPGESGKTTLSKQLRLLFGEVSDEEKAEVKQVIQIHCIRQMQLLLTVVSDEKLKISPGNKAHANKLMIVDPQPDPGEDLSWPENSSIIKHLWEDTGVQDAFKMRARFQVLDGVEYFFDSIDRLRDDKWVPTPEDFVVARQKTKEPTEFYVSINGQQLSFVDVGGQRAERPKWREAFLDPISAIFYVASISDFDQKLREDGTQNRMDESITLWNYVSNSTYFRGIPMVVILNKEDLFKHKLDLLQSHFPGYKGGHMPWSRCHRAWSTHCHRKERWSYPILPCKMDEPLLSFGTHFSLLELHLQSILGGNDLEKAKTFVKNRFMEQKLPPVSLVFTNCIDQEGLKATIGEVMATLQL